MPNSNPANSSLGIVAEYVQLRNHVMFIHSLNIV
jgi:hypothetical protein